MSVDLFDTKFGPNIIGKEGKYVNNPNDAGGETNWGITIGTARENGYHGPMRAMTREQALAIYKAIYYLRAGIHLIAPLSEKIAEEVFDTGVNMGVGTAGKYLQRALNALNKRGKLYKDINVDGMVGNGTAGALKSFLTSRKAGGEEVLLKALNCLQGARYIELSEGRSQNEEFTFGWLAQRVGFE